jgi:hypothetical protein
MELCLFGTHSDNIAGYCKLHRCGMTVKQIKGRECLKKQCWHLEKNESHQWWRQRDLTKQKREARKHMFEV